MANKTAPDKWVAANGVDWEDPKTGAKRRAESGEPYDGPVLDWLIEQNEIVPAPAGSSQPGTENDGSSA